MTSQENTLRNALVVACLAIRLLAGTAFLAPVVRAQEATRMQSDHAMHLDGGFESAFLMRLGYSYRADFLGDDGRIYARFTLPVVAPDLGDTAIDAGLRVHLYDSDGWGVQALGGPIVRHAENDLFAATAFGVRAVVLPGYQSETWGLLLDLGLEQMVSTYIDQSDLYEDTIYQDAKSGFYAFSAGTVHAGLQGGVHIGKLELSLRAGVMADTALQPLVPPFYLTLGSAYAL